MRTLTAFCAIATLVACIASPSRAADAPSCALQQYTSIDFNITRADDILIPITIGETPTFAELTLATAFNTTGPNAVETLKLETRSLSRITAATPKVGNRTITHATRPVPVMIGQLRITGVEFLVTSDVGGNISARVGLGLFGQADVELDFANQKLKVFSSDHCPGNVVYWADSFGAVPFRKATIGNYLVMELDGKKIETGLGTSTAITRLHADAAKRLFDIDVGAPDPLVPGIRPEKQRFMDLTANGIAVMNAQVDIEPFSPGGCRLREQRGADRAAGYGQCYNVFPLQLGMNVLKRMRIYFASKENMLYFTAADAQK
jgi:hypothetical protein